jgi:hypothetical protein
MDLYTHCSISLPGVSLIASAHGQVYLCSDDEGTRTVMSYMAGALTSGSANELFCSRV